MTPVSNTPSRRSPSPSPSTPQATAPPTTTFYISTAIALAGSRGPQCWGSSSPASVWPVSILTGVEIVKENGLRWGWRRVRRRIWRWSVWRRRAGCLWWFGGGVWGRWVRWCVGRRGLWWRTRRLVIWRRFVIRLQHAMPNMCRTVWLAVLFHVFTRTYANKLPKKPRPISNSWTSSPEWATSHSKNA